MRRRFESERSLDPFADELEERAPPARRLAPGKRTLTQLLPGRMVQAKQATAHRARIDSAWARLFGSAEPAAQAGGQSATVDGAPGVQGKDLAAGEPAIVHAAAARGMQSPSEELPYRDRIEASFGVDLSGVKAHVGGPGAEASAAMGAEAYASGNHVVFGRQPDLHTAAHEAAHVVQQQAGVQLLGGVGKAGDAYEKNADDVADRVVRGESARDLLPAAAVSAGEAATGDEPAVQRKPDDSADATYATAPRELPIPAIKRTIPIGGVDVVAEVKAEIQLKGKLGAPTGTLGSGAASGAVMESKLSALAKKVGVAFLKGKLEVEGFRGITISLGGSAAEVSRGDGKTKVGLGKIQVDFSGYATELLDLEELRHLRGKADIKVTGSLSWTVVDSALQALEDQAKRVAKRVDRLKDNTERLRKLKVADNALVAERNRMVGEIASGERTRGTAPKGRRAMLEKKIAANREKIWQVTREIDADVKDLDSARDRMRGLQKSLRSKLGKTLSRGMVAMSKNLVGRAVLKALPLVGWAATILDVVELVGAMKTLIESGLWMGGEEDDGDQARPDQGEGVRRGEGDDGAGVAERDTAGDAASDTPPSVESKGDTSRAPATDKTEPVEVPPLHQPALLVLTMIQATHGPVFTTEEMARLGEVVPENLSEAALDELQERIAAWPRVRRGTADSTFARLENELARIQRGEEPREEAPAEVDVHLGAAQVLAMIQATRRAALSPEHKQRLANTVPEDITDAELDQLAESLDAWSQLANAGPDAVLDWLNIEIARIRAGEPAGKSDDESSQGAQEGRRGKRGKRKGGKRGNGAANRARRSKGGRKPSLDRYPLTRAEAQRLVRQEDGELALNDDAIADLEGAIFDWPDGTVVRVVRANVVPTREASKPDGGKLYYFRVELVAVVGGEETTLSREYAYQPATDGRASQIGEVTSMSLADLRAKVTLKDGRASHERGVTIDFGQWTGTLISATLTGDMVEIVVRVIDVPDGPALTFPDHSGVVRSPIKHGRLRFNLRANLLVR